MDDPLREFLTKINESFSIAWTRKLVRFEQEHNTLMGCATRRSRDKSSSVLGC